MWLILARIFFIVCCLTGMAGIVCAVINQFRAAKNRKPEVSFTVALWLISILFHPEYYTDKGLRARRRVLNGLALFFVCFVLGLIVGIGSGVAH